MKFARLPTLLLGLLPCVTALGSDIGTLDKATAEKVHATKPPYSPYAGRNFPTRALFGDTHLHTSFSFDAGAFGARLGPSDAYRFAKGEEVTASSGQPARSKRSLPQAQSPVGVAYTWNTRPPY